MGSTRIKGNALILEIDGTEYRGDLTEYHIKNEEKDSDVTTFEDAAQGNTRKYILEAGFVQSTASQSLWRKLWDNAGRKNVPYKIAPHGNKVATADQPHFTGTLTLPAPGELGGEAGPGEFTTSAEFELDGKPKLVTA